MYFILPIQIWGDSVAFQLSQLRDSDRVEPQVSKTEKVFRRIGYPNRSMPTSRDVPREVIVRLNSREMPTITQF
jgi:hypothetical protein